MAMIEKINQLKSKTTSVEAKSLCEKAASGLNSTIYNSVTPEARYEIEKFSIQTLFEGLGRIKDAEVEKWLTSQKRAWAVKNIGVRESISNLYQTEAKDNFALKSVLNHFKEFIDAGVPEVRIFESFLTAMQSFSYYPKVGNAIAAIQDNVKNYKTDITIEQIVDAMKESKSNYLIPIIEDAIQNYLDNKNEQNKSFLKESIMKFSYDPFIREIINLVTLDATDLQLEHANAQCDIEKIYSPILYLGENEVVFAIKGLYYTKKGNTVSVLSEKESKKLDPSFCALCEAINNPNVVIGSKSISVYDGKDKAVITESGISFNGKDITNEEFANSAEIAHWTGKGNLLILVETLRRNFDEIAELDFAKRVFLKEDQGHSADVFKLRGNVFVATHNSTDGKNTFYRNVNPIQAKGIMMEHLRYDISRLFEGLLPEEEKILEEIEATKKDYRDYIMLLESKMADFKSNIYGSEISNQVIEALQEELNEVQDEFKDYLAKAEQYIRPLSEDITITVDVDGKKYSVPIPSNGEGGTVSPEGDNKEEEPAGSEPGKENLDTDPASAVTFDQDQTELLGDTPTIATDSVNLGGDEAEAEADKKEAEVKTKEKEKEGEEEGKEDVSDTEGDDENKEDLESGEKDEIKIEDKSDTDEEDEDDVKKQEESTEKPTEVKKEKEAPKKEVPAKRKVYLKKKA